MSQQDLLTGECGLILWFSFSTSRFGFKHFPLISMQCGRKAPKFLRGCAYCTRNRELACYVCKRKGHTQVLCPDRWRRYHSTVCI